MRSRQPLGISNPTSRMTSPDRASTGGCVLESSHTAGRGARVVLEGSSLDVARVGFLHRTAVHTAVGRASSHARIAGSGHVAFASRLTGRHGYGWVVGMVRSWVRCIMVMIMVVRGTGSSSWRGTCRCTSGSGRQHAVAGTYTVFIQYAHDRAGPAARRRPAPDPIAFAPDRPSLLQDSTVLYTYSTRTPACATAVERDVWGSSAEISAVGCLTRHRPFAPLALPSGLGPPRSARTGR